MFSIQTKGSPTLLAPHSTLKFIYNGCNAAIMLGIFYFHQIIYNEYNAAVVLDIFYFHQKKQRYTEIHEDLWV